MKRIITEHTIRSGKIPEKLRLAVASDLHSGPYEDLLDLFYGCDALLLPGDLVDRHRRDNRLAEQFLREVPEKVPVFFSLGNHEIKYRHSEDFLKKAMQSKVTLLRDRDTLFRGIRIGGLSSCRKGPPDLDFLDRFEKKNGFRLLMCHQPEVYLKYVSGRDIDFTVCGHAHGGQMEFFGRGLYAPGQGLFPKVTHGVHDHGKMMVSRGMTNGAKPRFPRFNNPCEVIVLKLEPTKEGTTG